MRNPMIWAALLAGTACSPAMAQLTDVAVATEIEAQAQAPAAVQPVAMAGDQEQRRDRGGREDRGGEGMRSAPERVERAARQDWQQRTQSASEAQAQAEPQPRREWIRERAENNDGRADRGWQRRERPVVDAPMAPVAPIAQAAPVEQQINRDRRRDNDTSRTWNRDDARQAQVPGVPPTWQRRDRDIDNDGIRNNRDRDRDGDGIRNNRDRDRDGDGIRNNRDWDRNNDGRVDRRWDGNNNGVIDRRYDRNRDGVRDGVRGNDGNWRNDGRHWGQQHGNSQHWNRGWRNDNRYDWQRYRSVNRNLYRAPRYYSPYGYNHRYQRFSIGIYLNQVFFGSRYRISNPWQYRLPYADWPYEWVRYYDDVLLVDTRNGYIVDVIHGFFW